ANAEPVRFVVAFTYQAIPLGRSAELRFRPAAEPEMCAVTLRECVLVGQDAQPPGDFRDVFGISQAHPEHRIEPHHRPPLRRFAQSSRARVRLANTCPSLFDETEVEQGDREIAEEEHVRIGSEDRPAGCLVQTFVCCEASLQPFARALWAPAQVLDQSMYERRAKQGSAV